MLKWVFLSKLLILLSLFGPNALADYSYKDVSRNHLNFENMCADYLSMLDGKSSSLNRCKGYHRKCQKDSAFKKKYKSFCHVDLKNNSFCSEQSLSKKCGRLRRGAERRYQTAIAKSCELEGAELSLKTYKSSNASVKGSTCLNAKLSEFWISDSSASEAPNRYSTRNNPSATSSPSESQYCGREVNGYSQVSSKNAKSFLQLETKNDRILSNRKKKCLSSHKTKDGVLVSRAEFDYFGDFNSSNSQLCYQSDGDVYCLPYGKKVCGESHKLLTYLENSRSEQQKSNVSSSLKKLGSYRKPNGSASISGSKTDPAIQRGIAMLTNKKILKDSDYIEDNLIVGDDWTDIDDAGIFSKKSDIKPGFANFFKKHNEVCSANGLSKSIKGSAPSGGRKRLQMRGGANRAR